MIHYVKKKRLMHSLLADMLCRVRNDARLFHAIIFVNVFVPNVRIMTATTIMAMTYTFIFAFYSLYVVLWFMLAGYFDKSERAAYLVSDRMSSYVLLTFVVFVCFEIADACIVRITIGTQSN